MEPRSTKNWNASVRVTARVMSGWPRRCRLPFGVVGDAGPVDEQAGASPRIQASCPGGRTMNHRGRAQTGFDPLFKKTQCCEIGHEPPHPYF